MSERELCLPSSEHPCGGWKRTGLFKCHLWLFCHHNVTTSGVTNTTTILVTNEEAMLRSKHIVTVKWVYTIKVDLRNEFTDLRITKTEHEAGHGGKATRNIFA